MNQAQATAALDPIPEFDGLPVVVERDRTLRVKVIDACGLTCTFCHNEGTPVAQDNQKTEPVDFRPSGRSGRVSIYLATNGARFLPATVFADAEFTEVLDRLRSAMNVTELHLTGGEPTLHPQLPALVAAGVESGFRVCMTSNGENGARVIAACAEAGLHRVNFSIFGTTAAELAQVQHHRFAGTRLAARKIRALQESIPLAVAHGVEVSANIVVPGYDHADRVRRLIDGYSPELSVRMLNSLDHGRSSLDAIARILDDLAAVPVCHRVTSGASGWRTQYRLPSGRSVWVKRIRPVRLPRTCAGCRFNNETDCQEGYYGVRLYRDRAGGFQVGVCIQRMDLCQPVDGFLAGDLPAEIVSLREAEHARLSRQCRSAMKGFAHGYRI
ncbi:radical SAM protein [Nocardia wallacei]|uniref:radical SAM protein n=1 Tax=Nocardia wallacei TaxID=480035 RepID=UPI00245541E4|nr:radical SAM protein [Nocardia wallacei]